MDNNNSRKIKLKDGFVVQKVGNTYLAVAVGERADNFNALIRMNGTGAYLWELLAQGEKTEEELLSCMLQEYDVASELARADISRFVAQLEKGGLIEE